MIRSRWTALGSAVAAIGFVLAQDLIPGWAGFHTWQYAAVLAILSLMMLSFLNAVRKRKGGERDRRLGVGLIGALIVVFAGLASGLLGPDTETIAQAPGTVTPLPEANAAAFFPNVEAQQVADGTTSIQLRRRDKAVLDLAPGSHTYLNTLELEATRHVAAYVEARDPSGAHLTITQPTNAAFLSPVLLFPQFVTIAGQRLPADAFAVPALHRQVKAFYFSKEASEVARARGLAGRELVLFAVSDDAERALSNGIGFSEDGSDVELGGIRLRATIGTYPELVISAVPAALALWLGGIAFVGGLIYAFGWRTT